MGSESARLTVPATTPGPRLANTCSGNRIIPARMPGVASTHPAQPKPAAFEHAMLLQGFHSEIGTTRKKPAAISQPGADCQLIASDQPDQQLHTRCSHAARFASLSRSASISPRHDLRCCPRSVCRSETGRFSRNTRSQGRLRAPERRNASLPWRLMELRSEAARAMRLGTIRPSLARP